MHYKAPDSNESADNLAQQIVVAAFVFQMLTIASAGGMPEHRAKTLYNEIMECYENLDTSAVDTFREQFLKLLNALDSAPIKRSLR
jgi:hypothetical protein